MNESKEPALFTTIAYEDFDRGHSWPPVTLVLSNKQTEIAGDWFAAEPGNSAVTTVVYPALYLAALRSSLNGIPAGAVLLKMELEFGDPVVPECALEATVRVAEKYRLRDRPCVTFECLLEASGSLIGIGKISMIWPIPERPSHS